MLKFRKIDGLRELARLPSPIQAWVARGGLDAKVAQVLRSTLLSITGLALDSIDRNGFLSADDSNYYELIKVIDAAHGFGGQPCR